MKTESTVQKIGFYAGNETKFSQLADLFIKNYSGQIKKLKEKFYTGNPKWKPIGIPVKTIDPSGLVRHGLLTSFVLDNDGLLKNIVIYRLLKDGEFAPRSGMWDEVVEEHGYHNQGVDQLQGEGTKICEFWEKGMNFTE